jgi:hypothetical protein
MTMDTGRLLEITFTLVLLYLVLTNAQGFGSSVGALSRAYVDGVKVLQGRS